MIYKSKSKYLNVIKFNDFESLPDNLKYSDSNPFGIMNLNLPIKCNRCGKSGGHGVYFKDGQEYIVCPGLYISTNMEVFSEEDLNKNYIKLEVIDAETEEDS